MTTVTLLDGRQVNTDSEEWRLECEARDLVNNRTTAFRREYIANVERSRGAAAAEQLRALVLAFWEERKR